MDKNSNQNQFGMKSLLHQTVRFLTGLYFVILLEFIVLVLPSMQANDFKTFLFTLCVTLTYSFLYILPSIIITFPAIYILHRLHLRKKYNYHYNYYVIYTLIIFLSGSTIFLLFIDHKIYSMFKFHINSFVINLVLTPGGIGSMGGSTTDSIIVIVFVLLCFFFSALLLFATNWSIKKLAIPLKKEIFIYGITIAFLVIMGTIERVEFAYFFYKNNPAIIQDSQKIFLYIPTRMSHFFKKLKIKGGNRMKPLGIKSDSSALNYPLQPIRISEPTKKYNIVWLVAESWRADTLNNEIMPATTKFSKKALFFHNHYSSGNGTRMALFGMFYGLYGSYWDAALAGATAPVIIKVLKQEHYQFDMYTSAKFTYPEFDKTIFINIDKKHLHQSGGCGGFKNDRENISEIFSFIRNRDKNKQFMVFMFFESPHAPYTFPEDCIVRKDYLPTFNYSTIDIAANIDKIKNRYLNSVHHLDTQLERVYIFLKKEQLMDNTIVIITGDHGEEFMEKGHWGHNESFHSEQIRSPLLIYIPGVKHQDITFMSSHLDLPATIAPFIGITNPPEDFSLGYNLLDIKRRRYTAVSSWNRICYIDSKFKYRTSSTQNILDPDKVTLVNDSVPTRAQKNSLDMTQVLDFMKKNSLFYKDSK